MAGAGEDWRASLREAGPYLSLGIQMGMTVAVCTLAGFFADRHFGTLPWLTIAGGAVGLLMLIVLVIRTLKEMNAASARRAGKRS